MDADKQQNKNLRYWIAPLLAGAFLGLGYGITQRLLILKNNMQMPIIGSLKATKPFPGRRLKELKHLNKIAKMENHKITQQSKTLSSRQESNQRSMIKIENETKLSPKKNLSEIKEKIQENFPEANLNTSQQSSRLESIPNSEERNETKLNYINQNAIFSNKNFLRIINTLETN